MSLLAALNALIIMNYWILNFSPFYFSVGEKPSCNAERPHEVGFLRDVCVEVGRNIHNRLTPRVPTTLCDELANTRTSTCIYTNVCTKWKRSYPWNYCANTAIMTKAVKMMKDFNEKFKGKVAIPNMDDQKVILESIEEAIAKLVTSKAANEDSDLINQMKQLRETFCSSYLNQSEQRNIDEGTSEAEALRLTAEENASGHHGLPANGENIIPINDVGEHGDMAAILRAENELSRGDSLTFQDDEEIARKEQLKEDLENDRRIASELETRMQREALEESAARRRIASETEVNDSQIAREMETQMQSETTRADGRREADGGQNGRRPGTEATSQAGRAPVSQAGRAAMLRAEREARERDERAASERAAREAAQRTPAAPSAAPQSQTFDVSSWTVRDPADMDFDDQINQRFPVIAFFYSANDPANEECKTMKSHVEQVIHGKNGAVHMVTVAIEKVPMTREQYNIVSAPYTMICLRGYRKEEMVGVQSVETIRDKLEKVIREAGQTPG